MFIYEPPNYSIDNFNYYFMKDFKQYKRSQIAEMREYEEGEVLIDRVSISASDLEAGSPKVGDMIARNPKNHEDQWLVAALYFKDNFEEM